MQRITEKMLELSLMRLNAITNSPTEPYTLNDDGKWTANIGNFHLSGAYGGYCGPYPKHSDWQCGCDVASLRAFQSGRAVSGVGCFGTRPN
jgi:hypothetical protein